MVNVKAINKINPSPEGAYLNLLENKEYTRIYVSTFASAMGYCEFKVPLILQGVKTETTDAMRRGTKVHKSLEKKEEQEMDFITLTNEEITTLLKEGKKINFKMEGMNGCLVHNNFHYVGRMDSVKDVTSRNFLIEEVKTQTLKKGRPPIVYEGHILQALTYAKMASEKYNIPLTKGKLRFRIIESYSKEEFEPVVMSITKKEVAFLYENLNRFEALYQNKAKPKFHGSINKCYACNPGFQKMCSQFKKINY